MLVSSVLWVCVSALPSPVLGSVRVESTRMQHVQLAELSPEHRARMRGDMRELWSSMSPGERAALAREHQEKLLDADPPIRPQRARYDEAEPGRSRQLSAEEHRHLRRQLRDLSGSEQ